MNDRLDIASRIAAGILADPAVRLQTKNAYEAIAAQALLMANFLIDSEAYNPKDLAAIAKMRS
jgi:hypothetical protein